MMESTQSQDWRREHDYAKVYDYLHDFVGCSKKQSLMDDLCDYLYMAKLDWAAGKRVKFSPEVALTMVTDPNSQEIMDLGGSLPGDLYLDHWGFLMADWMRQPSNTLLSEAANLKDTGGTVRTFHLLYSTINWMGVSNGGGGLWGSRIQIGSGTTAPVRANTGIETAFPTAPENAVFATGVGSYGGGTITVSGSITAGGVSGTINEAIFCFTAFDSGSTQRNVAFTRDATTSTAFLSTQSITVQYSFSD